MKDFKIKQNHYHVDMINDMVSITSEDVVFAYMRIGVNGKYLGGLQCNYEHESEDYNELLKYCEKIAESFLKINGYKL